MKHNLDSLESSPQVINRSINVRLILEKEGLISKCDCFAENSDKMC